MPDDTRTARRESVPASTATGRPAPGAGTPDRQDRPIYLQVADVLKRGIERGVWPVGSRLPTEVELCETHAISRFTAREAIRVLAAAGLVTRRQRIGTIVTALPEDARFNHEIRSLADLLQYARTTRMRFSSVVRAPVGRKEARRLGLREGEAWVRATGVRVDPGTDSPICVTRLYLNPMFVGIERRLRGCRTAVYALIEKQYGLSTERVEQELVGVALDEEDARMLGVPRGSPALQIIRHYYGANDRLLEVSDSVHPSDRFTYRVSVRK